MPTSASSAVKRKDWEPDYPKIYQNRFAAIRRLEKADEAELKQVRRFYAQAPWEFVQDWGVTFDPRLVAKGENPMRAFALWPRQRDYLQWLYESWKAGRRGLAEKSRDCGVTWLSVGFAVCMWLCVPGFIAGFGSRKEELVDKLGDDKSIFEKIRFFVRHLPPVLMPEGYIAGNHCTRMRLTNPELGGAIIGEAGDNIGRGGRTSIYIVDEAAFVEHQDEVDRALSQNTDCQIDISTPNGNGNAFYTKRMRFDGTDRIFVFDWRDDPRKDEAWYQRQQVEQEEVTVAQEIDRDYNASNEDAFIPAKWIAATVDAHKRLGIEVTGLRVTGFDPADTGDAKACVNRYGILISDCRQKKDGEITQALAWAFQIADEHRADILAYDGDGMGGPVMKTALKTRAMGRMHVVPFNGSGGVKQPGASAKRRHHEQERNPVDLFENYRAQAWWWFRERCRKTYLAIEAANKGHVVHINPDELIAISSECKDRVQLIAELSRPQRPYTPSGKIKVESKPDMKTRGVRSPNLADAAVIAMSQQPIIVTASKPLIEPETNYDDGVGY